jgi:hypothetical protein
MTSGDWHPNFRLSYWLSHAVAAVGGTGAIYGLVVGTYWLFPAGCGVALLALLSLRLRGKAKVPIPGMSEPLEGDFVPVGDPPPDELVSLEEPPAGPGQSPGPPPPHD